MWTLKRLKGSQPRLNIDKRRQIYIHRYLHGTYLSQQTAFLPHIYIIPGRYKAHGYPTATYSHQQTIDIFHLLITSGRVWPRIHTDAVRAYPQPTRTRCTYSRALYSMIHFSGFIEYRFENLCQNDHHARLPRPQYRIE